MQPKTTFTKLGREKSKRVINKIRTKDIAEKLENDYSDLSFKAIGILFYLKNKPAGWAFDEKDLYSKFKDGETAVRSGIKELKEHDIIIEEQYNEAGKQGKTWTLTL